MHCVCKFFYENDRQCRSSVTKNNNRGNDEDSKNTKTIYNKYKNGNEMSNVTVIRSRIFSGGEKVKMHRVPIQGLEPRVEFESLLVRVPVSENVRL